MSWPEAFAIASGFAALAAVLIAIVYFGTREPQQAPTTRRARFLGYQGPLHAPPLWKSNITTLDPKEERS